MSPISGASMVLPYRQGVVQFRFPFPLPPLYCSPLTHFSSTQLNRLWMSNAATEPTGTCTGFIFHRGCHADVASLQPASCEGMRSEKCLGE